jgi:hypothetical protein
MWEENSKTPTKDLLSVEIDANMITPKVSISMIDSAGVRYGRTGVIRVKIKTFRGSWFCRARKLLAR